MSNKKRYRKTDVPSLLQGDIPDGEEVCYITGAEMPCHFHHIMNGNEILKKRCEEVGAWVWVSPEEHHKLHNTREGIARLQDLKEQCQTAFEKTHTRKEWMGLFHKNYREDEEMNQAKQVLEYIQEHGSITQREATRKLGVGRLAARISDLRAEGYDIQTEMVPVRTRGGKARVARYTLE